MNTIDTITSRTNPTVRLVRSLFQRRAARYRERLFVAEGMRSIASLLDHGSRLSRLLIDASRFADVPDEIVYAAHRADAPVLAVDPVLYAELSDVETAQPAIGVFEMHDPSPPQTPKSVIALDGIQDPGNLGSILRSCRAAGVDAVLMSRGTVDPYSPKVIRATSGQFTALPIIPVSSPEALAAPEFAGFPRRIILADSSTGTPHTAFDWQVPYILVLGNEASGPSAEWSAIATEHVRIRMAPGIESLNVAAAAAVLLFEAIRDCAPE